eukprot:jgi/Botrbrau1/666/Bobra.0161s0050.1
MASAPWTPAQDGVHQICYLLAEFQKIGTNQGQILDQLEACKSYPDFNNYLAFIFAQGDSLPIEVRQSAGLLLKNNLKDQYAGTTEEFRRYIKLALLHAIGNPSKPLRHTVGTNVAVIVGVGGLPTWPELLSAFVQCLESNDPNSLEGALDALYKIVEDTPVQLETSVPGAPEKPSNVLVPRLLKLFDSPYEDAKCLSVSIMNLLAGGMPSALVDNIDAYLKGLFQLAHDPSPEVRKAVCTGLVQMLHLEPTRLQPHLEPLIDYMLLSTQDSDEGVALESCEFWSAFCEAQIDAAPLRPFLTRLIPVLLRNMVYEEHDDEVLDVEAAEEAALLGVTKEDKEQELKPFIPSGRGGHGAMDEGEAEGDEINRWNLRKCSAAGLDVLSTVFGQELLPIVLPIVQQRLEEPDWRERESAILALGAISEGCAEGLSPYIPSMVEMLLPKVSDPRPLVRSISCWALSRYSSWVVRASGDSGGFGQQQFESVLQELLRGVLDRNKHVQEAACSALATFEEEAREELRPRLPLIIETLAKASTVYTRRNLRMLYDAISTLADTVGPSLADPNLLRVLMTPLLAKWEGFADTDKELLPLLECFTSLAVGLGPGLEELAPTWFERCIRIITVQLQVRQVKAAGQATPVEYEREFIIGSLDLLSGLAEGLGASVDKLVVMVPMNDILMQCCQDPSPDVRQSAFALVGDLARFAFPQLQPAFKEFMAVCIQNLETTMLTQPNLSACNNACWSIGEMAVKANVEELQPLARPIVERLVPILAAGVAMPRSILENSAITLGRVAWIAPKEIAPHLEHFIHPWCLALRPIRDDVEKEHAFLGLCAMLRLNPQGALPAFGSVCDAIVSWRLIRCEGLRNEISQLMTAYKNELQLRGQWDAMMAQVAPAVRDKLIAMCGLT